MELATTRNCGQPGMGFDQRLSSIGVFLTADEYEKEDDKTILQYYLEKYFIEELTGQDRNLVIKLVSTLVTPKYKTYRNSKTAFRYVRNFNRYFTLQIATSDLSLREFNAACRMEFPLFKKQLDGWINDGKPLLVKEYLQDMSDATDRAEFENKVRAIIAYHYTDGNDIPDKPVTLKFNEPLEMLSLPLKTGLNNYYKNPEEYLNFFNDIISTDSISLRQKSDFIFKWNEKWTNKIFSPQEASSMCSKFFIDYYFTNNSLTEELIHMFENCAVMVNGIKQEYPQNCIDFLKSLFFGDFSEKNMEIFLYPTKVANSYFFKVDLFKTIFSLSQLNNFIVPDYMIRWEDAEHSFMTEFMSLYEKLEKYNFTDEYIKGELVYLKPKLFYKSVSY
jgi:hypothetical protein